MRNSHDSFERGSSHDSPASRDPIVIMSGGFGVASVAAALFFAASGSHPEQEQVFDTLKNISAAARACDLTPVGEPVIDESTPMTATGSRILRSRLSSETPDGLSSEWRDQEGCLSTKLRGFAHRATMAGECDVVPGYRLSGPDLGSSIADSFKVSVDVDCAAGNIAEARAEE